MIDHSAAQKDEVPDEDEWLTGTVGLGFGPNKATLASTSMSMMSFHKPELMSIDSVSLEGFGTGNTVKDERDSTSPQDQNREGGEEKQQRKKGKKRKKNID
jgi:hypothetical protein